MRRKLDNARVHWGIAKKGDLGLEKVQDDHANYNSLC